MSNGNPQLAQTLADRGEPEEILRALIDGGVLIVSNPDGSILVGQLEDESMAVAAFTSPEAYSQKSDTEEFQHADAALLLEIARSGEVGALVVDPESDNAALIPLTDVQGYLASTGQGVDEDTEVAFRPCEDAVLPELRTAITEQLTDYPDVQRVWVSDVKMPSGVEGIMLHVALTDGADPQLANQLLQSTMDKAPPTDRPVFAHLADEETEGFLTELKVDVIRR
jgi:SseB protein N-terminal domain